MLPVHDYGISYIYIYTERMSVTLSWHCLRPDLHNIWRVGGPLDQRSWKISKRCLPWQPLPWQPKNPLRPHKTPIRLWDLSGGGIGGTRIVVMDFCYHGNHFVAMATKECLETHRTLLTGSVATPQTRPSERVKVLVSNTYQIWKLNFLCQIILHT